MTWETVFMYLVLFWGILLGIISIPAIVIGVASRLIKEEKKKEGAATRND